MSRELTLEESNELFDNFEKYNSGEFADLARALGELSEITLADFAPSSDAPDINAVAPEVKVLKPRTRNFTVITLAGALVATAALGAAALTGYAPAPVVNFVKTTTKAIADTFSKVVNSVILEEGDEGGPITPPSDLKLSQETVAPENIVAEPTQQPVNEVVKAQTVAPHSPTSQSTPVTKADPAPATPAPLPLPAAPANTSKPVINSGGEDDGIKKSSEAEATKSQSTESKSNEVKSTETRKATTETQAAEVKNPTPTSTRRTETAKTTTETKKSSTETKKASSDD